MHQKEQMFNMQENYRFRKQRDSFVRDEVFEIIKNFYYRDKPYFPKQCEIIDEMMLRAENEGIKYKDEESYKKARKNLQSQVSKQLSSLVDLKKIVDLQKGRFGPRVDAVLHQKYGEEIISHVEIKRPDVFMMSLNMVAVEVADGYKDYAIDCFKNYLDENRCYDVITLDKYLVIMIKGFSNERIKSIRFIKDIVYEAYYKQHPREKQK